MEKLLIIGASIGQVPLVERAKAQGIHVTVATIPGNYQCIELADDVIYLDIFDRDGIVEEAKKRNITAVVSDQNDLMNPTVAYVAEKLELPGNSFETVMSYCNKNKFLDMCECVGVPTPKHLAITNKNYDSFKFDCPFPWIVKPADSQSSIGVQRIDLKEQFLPALDFALCKSPTHNAIVEEFFIGKEVVCEGFICEGRYYLLGFADRKYFDLKDVFIPSQTVFPSSINKNLLDKIVEYENKLAEYTKPNFAIVHSEYLVNENTGEIRIVESALRGGGVYISSDLIPLATGIDINDVLLKKAMGIDVNIEEVLSYRVNRASGYVCFYLPDGIIRSIEGISELEHLDCVHKCFINEIHIGSKTEKMTYKGARKGPILVKGNNREDLEKNIREVQNTLKINVEEPNGSVAGIVWR